MINMVVNVVMLVFNHWLFDDIDISTDERRSRRTRVPVAVVVVPRGDRDYTIARRR
jgi:hypothetical protein